MNGSLLRGRLQVRILPGSPDRQISLAEYRDDCRISRRWINERHVKAHMKCMLYAAIGQEGTS